MNYAYDSHKTIVLRKGERYQIVYPQINDENSIKQILGTGGQCLGWGGEGEGTQITE